MTFDDWFVKSSIPDSMKHDLFDCWFQALVSRDPEVSELRQQLQEVCNSIGSSEYMDPPDGGSVTVAEQVSRMREERDQLRQHVYDVKNDAADLTQILVKQQQERYQLRQQVTMLRDAGSYLLKDVGEDSSMPGAVDMRLAISATDTTTRLPNA